MIKDQRSTKPFGYQIVAAFSYEFRRSFQTALDYMDGHYPPESAKFDKFGGGAAGSEQLFMPSSGCSEGWSKKIQSKMRQLFDPVLNALKRRKG